MKKIFPFLYFIFICCEEPNENFKYISFWDRVYSIDFTSHLKMDSLGLRGSIPSNIDSLKNITILDLSGNRLTGSIPTEIGNLHRLRYLDLSGNRLIGLIPVEIGNLKSLTHLDLSNNFFIGSIPEEIENIEKILIESKKSIFELKL